MDKQDELATVILAAWDENGEVPFLLYEREAERIAAAVRAYLGSDEVVERMAEGCWQEDAIRASGRPRRSPWNEEQPASKAKWRLIARAALSAAGGGNG